MDRNTFHDRFLAAAARARDFARSYVEELLMGEGTTQLCQAKLCGQPGALCREMLYLLVMQTAKKGMLATAADLMAIPEEDRFHEVIDGEIVRKAMPAPRHGAAQRKLSATIDPYQRRPGPPGTPGGWWFVTEVEVEFEPHQVFRPDVAGWRRERLPTLPDESPVRVAPDWICEILSRSNAGNDLVRKKRVYHRCRVQHYWLIDPMSEMLSVHRWTEDGYTEIASAVRGEQVSVEPFEAIAISVGALFGDDEEEG